MATAPSANPSVKRRRWFLLTISATGIAVVATSVAIILDDPELSVEAQVIDGITSASSIQVPATSTISESVDGLERMQGVLRPSNEADEWTLGGLEIDVGPEEWMRSTTVDADIDGDGNRASLYEELQGVSGKPVEIWVRFDNTRNDAELFAVEEVFIRDPTSPRPPWAD